MTQDIASLGLRVDSSQVVTGQQRLDGLADAAERAETATGGVTRASQEATVAVDRTARSVANAAAHLAGIDPRLRAAANAFTRLPIGMAAMAGVTGAVAAAAVLAKAYVQGARESESFARAILLTGNSAGFSAGQLALMAQRLDNIAGTQAAATRALSIFVETGKVGADELERFTAIAQRLDKLAGVPIEETAEKFAALAAAPAEAAAKLQKTFNFQTPAVYDYIRAQEDAGNIAGAAAAAQGAYAGALQRNLDEFEVQVPLIVRGWNAIKGVANDAWDAMVGLGRGSTAEERLKELRGLRDIQNRELGATVTRDGRPLIQTGNDDEERRLAKIVEQQQKRSKEIAAQKVLTDAYVESQKNAKKADEDFAAAQKQINAAWTKFDLSAIDNSLSSVLAKYEGFNDELEGLRAANLVSEEEYFSRRRKLIENQTDAEIGALRAENAALAKQDELSSVERIAAQTKIADNQQRIAELRIRTASELRVIDIGEQHGLRETAIAYEEAQESAARYIDTLVKRFQVESAGLGLGEKARQKLRDQADLEGRFQDRRQQLDGDLRRGEITREQYEKLLAIEADALSRSEDAYEEHYRVLDEKQGSWAVGVSEGLNNILDNTKNVAGQVADALEGAFDRATDALVDFAMTGKGNFGDLARSIIADLLRIQLRIMASQALQSMFGGMNGASGNGTAQQQIQSARWGNTPGFGGGTVPFGGGRENGGPVSGGMGYVINENTPNSEMFFPKTDGWVVPSGGMGGITINSTVNAAPGTNSAELNMLLDHRDKAIVYEVAESIRRGRWRQ
jgi:lambda family phage tail tape measure protein